MDLVENMRMKTELCLIARQSSLEVRQGALYAGR
jgi:hypothetical protein